MELDALPDELLVEIFSLLDDGRLLLDCVSLVCKRWRRLAKDWRSWTGVRLEFEYTDWCNPSALGVDTQAKARVLLRAPALGSLELDGPVHRGAGAAARLIESAARRSRAELLQLGLYSCYFLAAEIREAMFGLLWRSRNRVRELFCYLPLQWSPRDSITDEGSDENDESDADSDDGPITMTVDDDEEVSVVGILAQLQRLEVLNLELHDGYVYAGELRGAHLPRLRKLDIHWSSLRFGPTDLAVDLLDASPASLRSLILPYYDPLPKPVIDAVARRVGLHHLTVDPVDLPAAVANMHRLSSVEGHQHFALCSLTLRQVAAARRALPRAAAVLAGLSTLSLSLPTEEVENKALRAELVLLLTDVLRAARNVTSLTLWRGPWKEVVDELPRLVPRVQELVVYFFGPLYPAELGALAALSELRQLRLHGPSREDEPGCQAFEAAAEELRRLRPDVLITN